MSIVRLNSGINIVKAHCIWITRNFTRSNRIEFNWGRKRLNEIVLFLDCCCVFVAVVAIELFSCENNREQLIFVVANDLFRLWFVDFMSISKSKNQQISKSAHDNNTQKSASFTFRLLNVTFTAKKRVHTMKVLFAYDNFSGIALAHIYKLRKVKWNK